MRLPFSKAYRAFKELDGFSDQECERFVGSVKSEAGWRRRGVLFDLTSVVLGPPIGFVLSAMVYRLTEPIGLAASFLSVSGVIVAVVAAVLFMRDGLLRRYLAQRLARAECRACRYSLLGLTAAGGAVRCPECGAVTVLAERGLSEEDLLIAREPPADGAGGPC